MSILDSLCNTCVFALRKQYCFDCPFMKTCPDSVVHDLPIVFDEKYCPHVEHDPDVCVIEVKVCPDRVEALW